MATWEEKIAYALDDMEEEVITGDCGVSSDLEIMWDITTEQLVGCRWRNITIPPGSTISSAYVTFYGDAAGGGPTNIDVIIKAEDVDNATVFAATTNNISDRTLTTASTNWTESSYSWSALDALQTDDISSCIQEVIDRDGWNSGNSIVIVLAENGTSGYRAESWDGNNSYGAQLTINYSITYNYEFGERTYNEGDPISFLSSGGNEVAASSNITATVTFSAGDNRCIIVGISIEDSESADVTGVTYRGEALTKINESNTGGGIFATAELWYGMEAAIAAGSGNSVVVSINEEANAVMVCGMLFENVLQEAPVDQGGTTVGAVDYISKTCSSVGDDSWLVDVVGCGNTGTAYAADSGQTEKYEGTAGTFRGAAGYHNNPTSSEVMGWTFSTTANRQALHVCEIKGTSGGDITYTYDFGDRTYYAGEAEVPEVPAGDGIISVLSSASAQSTTTLSLSLAAGYGRMLVLAHCYEGAGGSSTATYNGTAMTLSANYEQGAGAIAGVRYFILKDEDIPSSGNFVVTNGGDSCLTGWLLEQTKQDENYYDFDYDTAATDVANSTTPTINVTASGIILTASVNGGASTMSLSGGQSWSGEQQMVGSSQATTTAYKVGDDEDYSYWDVVGSTYRHVHAVLSFRGEASDYIPAIPAIPATYTYEWGDEPE